MSNMLSTVIPKSDQLNSDDLIGGQSKTVKVTKVEIVNGDQPVAIHYEGDNGKPYKACKSMRRVLIHCWGGDAAQYVGRSMTLYCDPDVKFGGLAVGGIRISHLSHIRKEMTVMLTATRANRKPFTVKPLIMGEGKRVNSSPTDCKSVSLESDGASPSLPTTPNVDDWLHDIETAPTLDGLKHKYSEAQKVFAGNVNFAKISQAKGKRKAELTTMPIRLTPNNARD